MKIKIEYKVYCDGELEIEGYTTEYVDTESDLEKSWLEIAAQNACKRLHMPRKVWKHV